MSPSAEALIDALDHIARFHDQIFVVRCGVASDRMARWKLAQDVALLHGVGVRTVVVHPGPSESEGIDRHQSSPAHHELVMSVSHYAPTVGLLGTDGAPTPIVSVDDGRVTVASDLVGRLVGEFVVILEAVGLTADEAITSPEPDDVAFGLASTLRAQKVIFVSGPADATAELEGRRRPVSQMRADADVVDRLRADAVTRRRLIASVEALRADVEYAHLLPEAVEHALLLELFTTDGVGLKLWPEANWALDASGLDLR